MRESIVSRRLELEPSSSGTAGSVAAFTQYKVVSMGSSVPPRTFGVLRCACFLLAETTVPLRHSLRAVRSLLGCNGVQISSTVVAGIVNKKI